MLGDVLRAVRHTRWASLALVLSMWSLAQVRPNIARPWFARDARMPEMWMSTDQLVRWRGYPVEAHEVRTDDGYLLLVHRIPPRRHAEGLAGRGTPVLFGHGMGSNSEQWLLREGDNLVLQLSDLGFDIWLANYRGTVYGRRHVRLSPKSSQFWAYSFHENGVLDQAAIIDHVLRRTGRAALLAIGHSMSCSAQLALLADRPEYGAKVLASVLMAPTTHFQHRPAFLYALDVAAKHYPEIKVVVPSVRMPPFNMLNTPIPLSCFPKAHGPCSPMCLTYLDLYMGEPHQPQNMTMLQLFSAHWPAGISSTQGWHYVQLGDAERFQKYDFGPVQNLRRYGSLRPPEYNLSQITSPLYLYYGATDNLVLPKNVELLGASLPAGTLRRLHRISSEPFNHLDFLASVDANETVYKFVIEDLMKHVPSS